MAPVWATGTLSAYEETSDSNRVSTAAKSHLSVLAKRDGSRLHVQHAGDEVALREAAERQRLLAVVVQVAAVGTVQPHVRGGAVVEVVHGPARHTHAGALIAAVLLHDVKLQESGQMESNRTGWAEATAEPINGQERNYCYLVI